MLFSVLAQPEFLRKLAHSAGEKRSRRSRSFRQASSTVLGSALRIRLFVSGLLALHAAGRLRFIGDRIGLNDRQEFERHLAPIRTTKCRVDGHVAAPIPHR